jgi:hypothetical protein
MVTKGEENGKLEIRAPKPLLPETYPVPGTNALCPACCEISSPDANGNVETVEAEIGNAAANENLSTLLDEPEPGAPSPPLVNASDATIAEGVGVTEMVGVGVIDAGGVACGVVVVVTVGVTEMVGVGVIDAGGVTCGVVVVVTVGVTVGVTVFVGVTTGVPDKVGVTAGVTVAPCVGVNVGVTVRDGVAVGLAVGDGTKVGVGVGVTEFVGVTEATGVLEGVIETVGVGVTLPIIPHSLAPIL